MLRPASRNALTFRCVMLCGSRISSWGILSSFIASVRLSEFRQRLHHPHALHLAVLLHFHPLPGHLHLLIARIGLGAARSVGGLRVHLLGYQQMEIARQGMEM